MTILQRLDLGSFPNSTGPRRKPLLHTPADYGLTKAEGFTDGWAQVSEVDDSWHMSAFTLDRDGKTATLCFTDAGGGGATYRSTQVLRVKRTGTLWRAAQQPDRYGCQNDPPYRPG